MSDVLIAPKPIADFSADEYMEYIRGFYALPHGKRSAKPVGPAPGLILRRTKTGKLSIQRRKLQRPFAYVTFREIAAFAALLVCNQSEVWQAFHAKKFIVAKDQMSAEAEYGRLTNKPF